MPKTYTQLYIQLVFAVQHRQQLVEESFREPLQQFACGIVRNLHCKPLSIYANPDHLHFLIGLHPDAAISQLVRAVKANTSRQINQQGWAKGRFNWQEGYGAFSYSRSQVPAVCRYIEQQPLHHQTTGFREEYLDMLAKAQIEYDPAHLFDFRDAAPADHTSNPTDLSPLRGLDGNDIR